jgi:hypothetical protein
MLLKMIVLLLRFAQYTIWQLDVSCGSRAPPQTEERSNKDRHPSVLIFTQHNMLISGKAGFESGGSCLVIPETSIPGANL